MLKTIDVVVEVTAADFNGKDFDGAPLKLLNDDITSEEANEVWKRLFKEGRIKISEFNSTDYARWDVLTADGIVTAEPGHVISYIDDVLTVYHLPE